MNSPTIPSRFLPRPRHLTLAAPLFAAVILSGCNVGPKYKLPSAQLAPFHNAPAIEARPAQGPTPQIDAWWKGFEDADLDRIVQRVLDQNLDLAASLTRVAQARALAKQMGAQNKPRVNLSAQDTSLRQSLQSPFGKVGKLIPGYDRNQNYYDLGVEASWELDLFGQMKNGALAATAEAQAAEAARSGTRITVVADAVDAYLQVRSYQRHIHYAQAQIDTAQHLFELVSQRYDAGVATKMELSQAEALLQQAKASLPPLKIALEVQLNRLDVLMGAQPGTYANELSKPAAIPAVPSLAGLSDPVDTLRRRPDVIAAEREVAASNARVGAALAGYYPSVSLSALLGYETITPGTLFRSATFQPQSIAGIRWRIFDFGRVSAEVAQARGSNAEALIRYRQTVLGAAADVENAFISLSESEARQQEVLRAVEALQKNKDLAEQAYQAGTVPLLDVLAADRQLLASQDDLAAAQTNSARAAVSSFRALGGGWKH